MKTLSYLKHHRLKIGSIAGILALQYFFMEFMTARAWTTPYSWSQNYISDLGVPECLNNGQLDRVVCSPLHGLMNTGFITHALIVAIMTLCFMHLISKRWRYNISFLAAVYCIGLLMVGFFPGSIAENLGGDSTRMILHGIGALLAIAGGNILIIATALTVRIRFPDYAIVSLLLGVVGTIATLLFAIQFDLGLGIGTLERFAVNPAVLWIVLTGAILLISVSDRSRSPERLLPK